MKIAAVVPTCRGFKIPDQTIDVDWYIVHDRERWPIDGPATHIVAPDSEMYGRRCDSIRAAGFRQAYLDGADIILTVDDDCFVPPDWAQSHRGALIERDSFWWNTIEPSRAVQARGTPYMDEWRKTAISHGCWEGVPDYDAKTQKLTGTVYLRHDGEWRRIGTPFPQSAMNFGFIREVAPVMYQPFQGEGTPFDRFADIWGGLLAQRVLSHHGYIFRNGGAPVYHQRASNVDANLKKEKPGMQVHEDFWRYVWDFRDFGSTIESSYGRLAHHVSTFTTGEQEWDDYFSRLARNMRTWVLSLDRETASAS